MMIVGQRAVSPYLKSIGHIGIITSLFDTVGITISIANGYRNRLAIGEHNRHRLGKFIVNAVLLLIVKL